MGKDKPSTSHSIMIAKEDDIFYIKHIETNLKTIIFKLFIVKLQHKNLQRDWNLLSFE